MLPVLVLHTEAKVSVSQLTGGGGDNGSLSFSRKVSERESGLID